MDQVGQSPKGSRGMLMASTTNQQAISARAVIKRSGPLNFAAASELCKRGYEVAFTSGHTTPVADLIVVSPVNREMFLVDVKGLYQKNSWLIKLKLPRRT